MKIRSNHRESVGENMAATDTGCKRDARGSRHGKSTPDVGARSPRPAVSGAGRAGLQLPRPLFMVYRERGRRPEHPDDVEAVRVAGTAVPADPGTRRRLQITPLRPGDGLEWMAVTRSAARSYLHERDQAGAPGDQVDLLVPRAPVPVQNRPAVALEQLGGVTFRRTSVIVSVCHGLDGGSRAGAVPWLDAAPGLARFVHVRERRIPELRRRTR